MNRISDSDMNFGYPSDIFRISDIGYFFGYRIRICQYPKKVDSKVKTKSSSIG